MLYINKVDERSILYTDDLSDTIDIIVLVWLFHCGLSSPILGGARFFTIFVIWAYSAATEPSRSRFMFTILAAVYSSG